MVISKIKYFTISLVFHTFALVLFFRETSSPNHRASKITKITLLPSPLSSVKKINRIGRGRGKKFRLKGLMVRLPHADPGVEVSYGRTESFQNSENSGSFEVSYQDSDFFEKIRRIFTEFHYPYPLRHFKMSGSCHANFQLDRTGKLRDGKVFLECNNFYVRACLGKFIRERFISKNALLKREQDNFIPVNIVLNLELSVFVDSSNHQDKLQESRSQYEETFVNNSTVIVRRVAVGDLMSARVGDVILSPFGVGFDLLSASEKLLRKFGKKQLIAKLPEDELKEIRGYPDY